MKKHKSKFGQSVRNRAYDLYLAREPMAEIARTVGVSAGTIARWRDVYHWDRFLAEYEDKMNEMWSKRAVRLINEERPKALARQISNSRALDKHLETKLNENNFLDAEELQKLSSAAKASADISSRIIGLGQKDGGTNINVGLLVSPGGVQPLRRIEEAKPVKLLSVSKPKKKVKVPF